MKQVAPSILRNAVSTTAWLVMFGLAAALWVSTALYWSFRTDLNFLLVKQDKIHDWAWMSAFYVHIAGGMTCLIVGPLQLVRQFRLRWPAAHRALGKLYVGSILLLAAPSGLYMAVFAEGGWMAGIGFALLSLLWAGATWLALNHIRHRRVADHRRWMIRSYAFTFAAVTLRLWVPFLSITAPDLGLILDHQTITVLTAWLSWIPNLLFAEMVVGVSGRG